MFSREYQSGEAGIEVFSASGKNPGRQWKVSSSVHRVYDKTVKGFVFLLDKKATAASSSHASALMQLPPVPSKQTLGLTQGYLVLQMRLLAKKPLTVEINILSLKDKRQRYRLHLSNKFRTVEVHEMHAQIPLAPLLAADTWTHLIVDVARLTSYFFKNRDFGSIDSINLHSGCRLRGLDGGEREHEKEHDHEQFYFHCPHNFDFPVGTSYEAKVLDVSYFEGKGAAAFSIEVSDEVASAKEREEGKSHSISRKSKTPQSKSTSGSKSSRREAFENKTNHPGACPTPSEAKQRGIEEQDRDRHNNTNSELSSAVCDSKHSETRRKSSNPETKKQLMALNSRRQQQQQQQQQQLEEHHRTSPPTSPLQPPSTGASPRHQQLPVPLEIVPTMMMTSIEHTLPTSESPVVASQHSRVVHTSEVVQSLVRCSEPPPRETIAATVQEEEEEEEQQEESGSWAEAMTSQEDYHFRNNNTIFTFPTTAAVTAKPHPSVENPQDEDTHSESTACFSFDHEEEEFKEHDGCDESDDDEEEDEGDGDGYDRDSGVVVDVTQREHHSLSPSSPVQCLSPAHGAGKAAGAAGRERGSDVDADTRRGGRRSRGESSQSRGGVRRSRVQRDLQRLKEHFYAMKCEFVEEYGEGEARRLLQLGEPALLVG